MVLTFNSHEVNSFFCNIDINDILTVTIKTDFYAIFIKK